MYKVSVSYLNQRCQLYKKVGQYVGIGISIGEYPSPVSLLYIKNVGQYVSLTEYLSPFNIPKHGHQLYQMSASASAIQNVGISISASVMHCPWRFLVLLNIQNIGIGYTKCRPIHRHQPQVIFIYSTQRDFPCGR